jgi:hypothetical protein
MNKVKDLISFLFGVLDGFGKECFALVILAAGIYFRLRGLIDGGQFVDLLKNIGIAYFAGHTINATWGKD